MNSALLMLWLAILASPEATKDADDKAGVFRDVVTREGEVAGVAYASHAGLLTLKDDAGKERGDIFFTYYAAKSDGPRPITYVFNGGPGAASVWLHLGTAGPYRVQLADDGSAPAGPHVVAENLETWLTFTDLCFVDPVGTGFSRAKASEKDGKVSDEGERFYGVEEDAAAVAEFVRLHCTEYKRWGDPKYLAGESYGTTRAAKLALVLHEKYGLDVQGVILISAVLDFTTIREAANNPLTHVMFLPTMAATAAFHDGRDPEAARAEAEAFAVEEYLPALMRGAGLGDEERAKIEARLAELTGLSETDVRRADLRPGAFRFMQKVLQDQRLAVGRMDGRLTGYAPDALDDTPDSDPSLGPYLGVYAGAFNAYLADHVGYETDRAYEVLSRRVQPWKATRDSTGSYSGGYLNVADDLQRAMLEIPGLKLMVASGTYDLATPYFAADYTVDQLKLPTDARERITQTYYAGGHMMYHVPEERIQLRDDLRNFIEE